MRSGADTPVETRAALRPVRAGLRATALVARCVATLATAIAVLLTLPASALAGKIEGGTPTSGLPFTGIDVPLLAGVGIALLAAGVLILRLESGGGRHDRA